MLDLQDVNAGALDVFGNLMAVGRAKQEGTQNEHIERALQELGAVGSVFGRHDGRHSTLPRVDALPSGYVSRKMRLTVALEATSVSDVEGNHAAGTDSSN